jgi:hypothetical protein
MAGLDFAYDLTQSAVETAITKRQKQRRRGGELTEAAALPGRTSLTSFEARPSTAHFCLFGARVKVVVQFLQVLDFITVDLTKIYFL